MSNDFYSADPARRHYFAVLRECWDNLPDDRRTQFPSPEHLRKHCLIKAGWCDTRMIDAGSNKAALRAASAMEWLDPYALVVVKGSVLMIAVARSQTRRAQPKAQFMKTKQAVFRILEEMLGVSAEDLARVA
jgi:hypothetical protein